MGKFKIKGTTAAAALFIFFITFGLGLWAGSLFKAGGISEVLKINPGKSYNILVMGIDAQKGEKNSRSDTMILVSMDKKSKKTVMVWIPRDTRVEIGQGRYDKINSINYIKGPEAAMEEVGKLLGLKIDYYVTTNFGGFAEIIDILGGIHIDVPYAMNHYDPNPALAINLSKGPQILNGQNALGFVRYRGGPTADIGRTARQQQFIKALADGMFSTKAILKLPQLMPEIIENVKTNIPVKEMLSLADAAKAFDPEQLITQTLPGYSSSDPKTGASYWIVDEKIASGIVNDLLAGKNFDVAQDPPPSYNRVKNEVPDETIDDAEADGEEVREEDDGELQDDILSEMVEATTETEVESFPEDTMDGEDTFPGTGDPLQDLGEEVLLVPVTAP